MSTRGTSIRRCSCACGSFPRSPSSTVRGKPAPATSRATLASFPGSVRGSGPSACQRVAPTVPVIPTSAMTSLAPPRERSSSRCWSAASAIGPCSTVLARPTTAADPPTWSRSKCVSTTRSSRETPKRVRQARSASGSGPVSTSATAPRDRQSVASPWPTSHIATCQSAGTVRGPATVRTAVCPAMSPVTRPTTSPAPAVVRRHRFGAMMATAIAALTVASRAAPSAPSGQGRFCAAMPAVTWATAAIQVAGTHARAVSPSRSHGKGAMHARAPAMVAGAAAGSASMLAATPSRGTCGSMRTMSGPHTSCADSGTPIARPRARGIHRLSPVARGRASTSRAAVAAAESANPIDSDSHGSTTSSTVTARDSTAIPTAGRPSESANRATRAIAAARMTLGSGVTRATKAASTTVAPPMRAARGAPHSASTAKAAPTTIAQFAPETAVRCDSDEAFIAVSVVLSSMLVSPTARPGTRPAPGCGSPTVECTNARRTSSSAPQTPGGGVVASTVSARTRRTARSVGSLGDARPVTVTVLPSPTGCRASRASTATATRAGTAPLTRSGPAVTASAIASNQAVPSGRTSTRPVTVTLTVS